MRPEGSPITQRNTVCVSSLSVTHFPVLTDLFVTSQNPLKSVLGSIVSRYSRCFFFLFAENLDVLDSSFL